MTKIATSFRVQKETKDLVEMSANSLGISESDLVDSILRQVLSRALDQSTKKLYLNRLIKETPNEVATIR